MDEKKEREARLQALSEKVEKLDRIVYRLWKDLKELEDDKKHTKEA